MPKEIQLVAESPQFSYELNSHRRRRFLLVAVGVLAAAGLTWWATRSSDSTPATPGPVVHEEAAGGVTVRLTAAGGRQGLTQGRTQFVLEFLDVDSGAAVDTSGVRVASAMAMPGMVMTAPVSLEPAGAGRYRGTAEFDMAGVWRFTVEWTGPSGAQSVSFDGAVR